jgi:hypothetical protein
MTDQSETFETPFSAAVTRRGAMGGAVGTAAALSIAGTAMPAIASVGATGEEGVRVFTGRYPIDGSREIEGYFAAPVGGRQLDVVVLVPNAGTTIAAAQDAAHGFAARGVLAVVPNLPAERDAMIAELRDAAPRLTGMAHGNGTVRIVGV